MSRLTASYFDGNSAQVRPVTLDFHPTGHLEITGENLHQVHLRSAVDIDPPLGRTHRFIRLPDGGRCEVADHNALENALAGWSHSPLADGIHRLEKSWSLVTAALLVLSLCGWLIYQYGIPWGARQVAFALPADLTRRLGSETLTAFDKSFFDPSALPESRRSALQTKFLAFLRAADDRGSYRIEFRHSEALGANAFALPSGDIVITDELVGLADDDDELVAVLAHECGHVTHRHALRSVLQNSTIFVVMALVTGDVSSATAFGSALPTYLMQSKFSREFEAEADQHAVRMLRTAGKDPAHLARMLEHLGEHSHESKHAALSYLSSHPPTAERIQAIKEAK